ncbi:hypothetical protein TNCV_1988731 [Trichonephila clavipes]|nr:hypothetical protein TNCV_1988731 [Trichonephila clavipes]
MGLSPGSTNDLMCRRTDDRSLLRLKFLTLKQWPQCLSGSASRFHITGPKFKPRAGQGRLNFSQTTTTNGRTFEFSTFLTCVNPCTVDLQKYKTRTHDTPALVDKSAPSLLECLTLGDSRQIDLLAGTSAHAPQGSRSHMLSRP